MSGRAVGRCRPWPGTPPSDRELNRALVTWAAYGAAVIATMVAFTQPIAFVTTTESGEALPADVAVSPLPQWMALVAIGLAVGGGRLRRWWGGALGPAVGVAVLGGVLGGVGGMMLVDGYESDAGGRLGPGGAYVTVAAALAVSAMVLNAREHLLRQNPWRLGATRWALAIVVAPLASLLLAAVVTWGRALPFTAVVLVGVGILAGRKGEERWTGRAGL